MYLSDTDGGRAAGIMKASGEQFRLKDTSKDNTGGKTTVSDRHQIRVRVKLSSRVMVAVQFGSLSDNNVRDGANCSMSAPRLRERHDH